MSEEASGAPLLHARLAPGDELTALVVDDSTINRRILATLLESAGIRVVSAAGGAEAIALARSQRPDVIFMDVKMADVDGIDATRRLKADAATAAIPVIAVTASAFGETRQEALAAGCVDYLPKPVRAELIFGALQSHLRVRFVIGESDPATEPAPPAPGLDDDQRQAIAGRIRGALDIGGITDLQRLGQELTTGSAAEREVGQRVVQLAAAFDFDALAARADSLSGAGFGHAAD
jgi:CheY-like chemotaxis protein